MRKYNSELPKRKKTERAKEVKNGEFFSKNDANTSALEEYSECEIFVNPKQQEKYEILKQKTDAQNAELIENQYSQYVNDIGTFLDGEEEVKEGDVGDIPQFLKLEDDEDSSEEDREDQNWDDTPKHDQD